MATRRTSAPPNPQQAMELLVTRDDAKQKLQDRIEKGLELKGKPVNTRDAFDDLSNAYSKWNAFNSELLRRIFTTEEAAKEYDFWGVMVASMYESSLGEKIADVYKDIDKKIHRLDSIIERLELIPLSAQTAPAVQPPPSSGRPKSTKVFVVHGHDEVAKTSLEVFLHELGNLRQVHHLAITAAHGHAREPK